MRRKSYKRQIVDLHPPEPPEEPAPPSGIRVAPTIAITAQDVARAVKKKLARGSAPGPDGWTRELLIPLVEDQRSLNELTALITDLIGARIHPGAACLTFTDVILSNDRAALADHFRAEA